VLFIFGLVIGFILSVIVYLYLQMQHVESPSKWEVETTNKRIEEQQKKLGMTCAESPEYIQNYINSLTPIIETLKKNKTIDSSDSILLAGDKARDVFFTCTNLNRFAKVNHMEFPIPPLLNDEKLEASIIAIGLKVGQATTEWCEAKCITNALNEISKFMNAAKERLNQIDSKASP
jgi:uncharacterized membrane-anchored protein YhcB (DUF1043 family)